MSYIRAYSAHNSVREYFAMYVCVCACMQMCGVGRFACLIRGNRESIMDSHESTSTRICVHWQRGGVPGGYLE